MRLGLHFINWIVGLCGLLGCVDDSRRQARIPPVPDNGAQVHNQVALKSLTRFISRSSSASAYAKRAVLYLGMNRIDEALSDIDEALVRNDNVGRYHLIKAQALRGCRRVDDAFESALRAEGLGVDTPELFILIGDLLQEKKEFRRARLYLVKSLQMAPYDGEAVYFNGLIEAKTGDTSRALVYFRRAMALKPTYKATYVQLTAIHTALREYTLALDYNEKALTYFPNDAQILYGRGLIYQYHYRLDSAYVFYEQALQLQPALFQAHFQAGIVAQKVRDWKRALQHFSEVKKWNSRYPRINLYLASCYEQIGKWDLAEELYRLEMRLNPADQQAQYGIWRVQRQQMSADNKLGQDAFRFTRPGVAFDTTPVRQPQSHLAISSDSSRN